MSAAIFDDRALSLGEGPLWHPERQGFFWFDINAHRLFSDQGQVWEFDGYVSAAGWVDHDRMIVAGQRALMLFNIETGAHEDLCPLEADDPRTRTNDGRADPYGGFWIGTMGIGGEAGAGSIYRYYRGELRVLYPSITIPNSICFAPDGTTAYFTDTDRRQIWRQRLDPAHGWPIGEPETHIDTRTEGWHPDGSVVDAAGNLWNAQYGGARVAVYGPDGGFVEAIAVPALNPTCPAFGGPDLTRMIITTASQRMDAQTLAREPAHGKTYLLEGVGPGLAEHRMIL